MNLPIPLPPAKVEQDIRELADKYAVALQAKMEVRMAEMNADENTHYLLYRVLGVPDDQGDLIDRYQNKGRFLYNDAGTFLEKAAKLCFKERFPGSRGISIANVSGKKPVKFNIDLLIEGRDAIEIKWRDATTDGDHINKELDRLNATIGAGYRPIRIMFYYPTRPQAMDIQRKLEALYLGTTGGQFHHGEAAWEYVEKYTAVNLKALLQSIAKENIEKWQKSKP